MQIEEIEKQIKELEASFNSDTPYQIYREYETLMIRVNLLYEEWSGFLKEE